LRGNGGTHVGHLWSSTGVSLGAATFSGEPLISTEAPWAGVAATALSATHAPTTAGLIPSGSPAFQS
jgi:hypothetical protein